MKELKESFLFWCVVAAFGAFCFSLGYASTHSVIARECARLGAFYVGEKTFKCESKP